MRSSARSPSISSRSHWLRLLVTSVTTSAVSRSPISSSSRRASCSAPPTAGKKRKPINRRSINVRRPYKRDDRVGAPGPGEASRALAGGLDHPRRQIARLDTVERRGPCRHVRGIQQQGGVTIGDLDDRADPRRHHRAAEREGLEDGKAEPLVKRWKEQGGRVLIEPLDGSRVDVAQSHHARLEAELADRVQDRLI